MIDGLNCGNTEIRTTYDNNMMTRVDLHTHTFYSDGKHPPEYICQQAADADVSHLAITDHDCIDAWTGLQPDGHGVTLIAGVEISSAWENLEIHVVGLCFDQKNTVLLDLLKQQKIRRQTRIQAINSKLEKLGSFGLSAYIDSLGCHSPTRSHVADFLVYKKLVANRQKAFKKYLGPNGKIYVTSHWCELQEAISTINQAGGIAVLAHPDRYNLTRTKLRRLVHAFEQAGGSALEASYSQIDNIAQKYLKELALEFNMYLSMGSDFHTEDAPWTRIGKMPAINFGDKKNAIWDHPKWRSL